MINYINLNAVPVKKLYLENIGRESLGSIDLMRMSQVRTKFFERNKKAGLQPAFKIIQN